MRTLLGNANKEANTSKHLQQTDILMEPCDCISSETIKYIFLVHENFHILPQRGEACYFSKVMGL